MPAYYQPNDDRPTDYCIGYADEQLWQQALAKAGGERDAVDPIDCWRTEDAKTRMVAFKLARRRAYAQNVSVSVYLRPNIAREADGGWDWDEDDCIAVVEPDGSVTWYERGHQS